MKVSSISGNPLESGLIPTNQDSSLLQAAQGYLASLFKTIDRIGTAIALGEKGDLEAAHQFRVKSTGKN